MMSSVGLSDSQVPQRNHEDALWLLDSWGLSAHNGGHEHPTLDLNEPIRSDPLWLLTQQTQD